MNTEDKLKLVDAINCKFPQNNIMELYYDIGRVLPLLPKGFLMVEYLIGTEINTFRLLE